TVNPPDLTKILQLAGEGPGQKTSRTATSFPTKAEGTPLAWIRACDVERESVEWIWKGRIARGKITVLEGDPGTGKTTIALSLAACISTGRPLPGEVEGTRPRTVLVFSSEDDIGDTLRPRLEAAGADLTRVVFENLRDPTSIPFMLPRDLEQLERSIAEHDAALVIIDPVLSYLDPDVDSHKDQSVRTALMPLAALCQRTHVAVLLHRHLNKDSSKSALYRGGGSIAFAGVARLVLLAAENPDDPGDYVLARTKGNLGRPPPSLSYSIGDAGNDTGVVLWGGVSDHTAATLLAPEKPGPKPDVHEQAKRYLADLLASGPRMRAEVIEAGARVNLNTKAMERAFTALGLVSEPRGKERAWRLP
ncbi:MAG: AAA family ATPase, partial [Deltaproteobacteria bacterium]